MPWSECVLTHRTLNPHFPKESTAVTIAANQHQHKISVSTGPCEVQANRLSNSTRCLLSCFERKLLFLSCNRNPDSSVSQRFISIIRIMLISVSFGLASVWVKPRATISQPEKQKSEDMPSAWSFFWCSSSGYMLL